MGSSDCPVLSHESYPHTQRRAGEESGDHPQHRPSVTNRSAGRCWMLDTEATTSRKTKTVQPSGGQRITGGRGKLLCLVNTCQPPSLFTHTSVVRNCSLPPSGVRLLGG